MNRMYKNLLIRYACFPEGVEGRLEVTRNGKKTWCMLRHNVVGDRYIITRGMRVYLKDCIIL